MAKYSTWGMWEPESQDLINAIAQDSSLQCTHDEIRTAILGKVIPQCLEAAFEHNLQATENSPLDRYQQQLSAYKVSLDRVLPVLSEALGKQEEALSPHVSIFLKKVLIFISDMEVLKYLETLKVLYTKILTATTKSLYGGTLEYNFVLELEVNDSEARALTYEKMKLEIPKNCPESLQPRMLQQLILIEEVIQNRVASADFEDKFLKKTGESMALYKKEFATAKNTTLYKEQKESPLVLVPKIDTPVTIHTAKQSLCNQEIKSSPTQVGFLASLNTQLKPEEESSIYSSPTP